MAAHAACRPRHEVLDEAIASVTGVAKAQGKYGAFNLIKSMLLGVREGTQSIDSLDRFVAGAMADEGKRPSGVAEILKDMRTIAPNPELSTAMHGLAGASMARGEGAFAHLETLVERYRGAR